MLIGGSNVFPHRFFFIIKTLDYGEKLEIIHKITLKDTCTRPRKCEKADPENLELLSRNARSENGVLIERKRRISASLFGSKSDENSDFEGVKQEEFWYPEKWWFLLRLWFVILWCWRDEKLILLPSQFWIACSAVLATRTSGHAMIDVGPIRWSFGNFHGCSQGNIIWLGVQL